MTAKRFISLIALIAIAQLGAAQDRKLVPVTISLQWFAQPEDGEFFAAKAEGIYEKYGLDVRPRDSSDTRGGRYGAMSDVRWEAFFKDMVAASALPPTLEYRKAYTLQFVKDL